MQFAKIWIVGLVVVMGLLLAGCSRPAEAAEPAVAPAVIEKIEGTELNRVTLVERAAERLGIQTTAVKEEQVGGEPRLVVPYSALIYDLEGQTWVYVSPENLVYTRQPVTVDYIEGDRAVLTAGPEVGTTVVTVGVAELYGADTGIGK